MRNINGHIFKVNVVDNVKVDIAIGLRLAVKFNKKNCKNDFIHAKIILNLHFQMQLKTDIKII